MKLSCVMWRRGGYSAVAVALVFWVAMFGGLAERGFGQLPDSFSQSALNTINGDLEQEIMAGSTNAGTWLYPAYVPSSNLNMLPYLVGSTGTGGEENLLKVSVPGAFFSGGNYSTTGMSRASPALTTGTSLDGRYFTAALWNAPLLMPVTSGSDYTPALASGSFGVPNWILVSEDEGNPTVWYSGLLASSSNTSSIVVGRFAYTIYHEGGLLDANVAGYPSTSTAMQTGYKPALPYADLTQIGLTAAQVDTIVGWRNYASTQAPGTPTMPDFTAASGSNYYEFVLSNTNGFLTPSTAVFNDQTDQMFTSRQELINFMENEVGVSGTGLDVLNYLATFTRGVDQPSISPDPTRPLITLPYSNGGNNLVVTPGNSYELKDAEGNTNDPVNPTFLAVQVQAPFTRNDGSTAVVGEPLVKKRFPLNRLAWLTYLGPSANRNIPASNPGVTSPDYDMWQLVNVYGISPAYLQEGTAANIENYFGLVWQVDTVPSPRSGQSASFHDGEYKWFYSGHNTRAGTVTPGSGNSPNSTGSISRLEAIANQEWNARDPDFFELLKAAVGAGSIAKGSMNINAFIGNDINSVHPYYYQAQLDTNLDYAIIQLGANIIDQAKVDGYSTRIVFNDGNDPPHEFRGVENLPYLYRLNSASLKLRMENPPATATDVAGTLKDPGVAAIVDVPTIWNPYDAKSPLGDPSPAGAGASPALVTATNFRLIADSVQPDSLAATNTTGTTGAIGYTTFIADGYDENQVQSKTSGVEKLWTTGTGGTGTPITPTLSLVGTSSPIYPGNSQMTFVVPDSTLFREPTVLAMPNYPAKSQLALGAPPSAIVQYNLIQNQYGQPAYKNGGFLSDAPNPLNLPLALPASQPYIGIFAAIYPVEFASGTGASTLYRSDYANLIAYNGVGPYLTYRLQYRDPNTSSSAYSGPATIDPPGSWVTYDEKYTQFNTIYLGTAFGASAGNLADQADAGPGGDWQSYADPRTSRFSAINGRALTSSVSTPGETGESQEFADPNTADGIGPEEVTDRPDVNAGYAISSNRPGSGEAEFDALAAAGWNISTSSNGHFRIGMISQNSSLIYDNGVRFNGDSQNNSSIGDGPQHTYFSDPDGVTRGAMGVYRTAFGTAPAYDTVGLPLATAYPGGYNFLLTGTYQGQSRPYFLHRPFRSVAELGYVFSGTPWKNIDFFTPQSGDASLLDLFTINETPAESSDPNSLVAGTVNLNTRQAPVLQALLAGAYVDEALASGVATTPFPPITGAQANEILTSAYGLISRTTSTATGQGPLQNVSELVGRWDSALSQVNNYAAGYTGPSGDLTNAYAAAFSGGTLEMMQNVQRLRESFIRPLAAAGNTRVWNLMIDLVVQDGQYPATATGFDNFAVSGEQRYWVHEAIDRSTGQIVDQSVETVGPSSLSLSGTTVVDNLAAGTMVATLESSELLGNGPYTFALVSGSDDDGEFSIVGNQLVTNGVFDALAKNSYNVEVIVTDTNGLTYTEPVTITVQPGAYSQWKIANFGANASNPAVAGDLVDSQNDGLPNLLKYALGKSPNAPATTGITVHTSGGMLTMNYTQASAATDVTVSAVTSADPSDPTSWSSSGVTQTMLNDNGTIQQWQATAAVNGSAALFMKLTVTRP